MEATNNNLNNKESRNICVYPKDSPDEQLPMFGMSSCGRMTNKKNIPAVCPHCNRPVVVG